MPLVGEELEVGIKLLTNIQITGTNLHFYLLKSYFLGCIVLMIFHLLAYKK